MCLNFQTKDMLASMLPFILLMMLVFPIILGKGGGGANLQRYCF